MNSLIPLYVTLQTFVHGRIDQLKERNDRGVSALEYGALIVVAAIVVGILTSLINKDVKEAISTAIGELFGGGEGGGS